MNRFEFGCSYLGHLFCLGSFSECVTCHNNKRRLVPIADRPRFNVSLLSVDTWRQGPFHKVLIKKNNDAAHVCRLYCFFPIVAQCCFSRIGALLLVCCVKGPWSGKSETPSVRAAVTVRAREQQRRPPFYIIGNPAELRRGVTYPPPEHIFSTHTPEQTSRSSPGKREAELGELSWRFSRRRRLFYRCLETMCWGGARAGGGVLPDTLNTR